MSTEKRITRAQLIETLSEKEKQLQEYIELSRRIKADFENFKKWTHREKEEWKKFANEDILKGLLDVVDNFDRALKPANQETTSISFEGFREGMVLIKKQLDELIKNGGVIPIE